MRAEVETMFSNTYSQYHIINNGVKYVNTGILSMTDTFRYYLYSTPKTTILSLISVSAIMIDSGQIMKQITAQCI